MAIETTLEVVEKPCDGDYLRYALETAAEAVEYMVRNYCVPSLWVVQTFAMSNRAQWQGRAATSL
jgi:hypothetical protein